MPFLSSGRKKNLYLICRPKIDFTLFSLPTYCSGQEPWCPADRYWGHCTADNSQSCAINSETRHPRRRLWLSSDVWGTDISGIETAAHTVRTTIDSDENEAAILWMPPMHSIPSTVRLPSTISDDCAHFSQPYSLTHTKPLQSCW